MLNSSASSESRDELVADYLVLGAGAMGMAFADEILRTSKTARVVIVDRRAKPGGHWNSAYRFVTLHQPALYYGVNSEPLGDGERDLASQAQILAYYEKVQKKLEATGRFRFLPLSEVQEDGSIRSLAAPGETIRVRAKKTVDATYMNVQVPSTTPPKYEVGEKVALVPVNGLAELNRSYARYVVVGSGKTGIDAALYLLDRGVDPDAITWIMPNDAWFLNRDALYPDGLPSDLTAQLRAVSQSKSMTEVFERLEADARLLRLDPDIWPTKYRCATVTNDELDALRQIKDIERHGRVRRIEGSTLELETGIRELREDPSDVLYVDCTADGLAQRPARPIFEGDRITLQAITMCQQVMSAAAIAAIDLRVESDDEKNAIVQPVPHPLLPADYLRCITVSMTNRDSMTKVLFRWLFGQRLSMMSHIGKLRTARLIWDASRIPVPTIEDAERLIEAG